MKNLFRELIRVNSGISSKSFFLVLITIIGCLLLLVVGFVLIWEVVHSNTINTDLGGLALLIGSITTLFGAAGLTKVYGERNEVNEQLNNKEEQL